jgi:hypothetical protein
MLILFAKSATNLEKLHQVGGFGEPPNVILKQTQANARQIVIVCATARALWAALWAIRRQALLQSHLDAKIVQEGHASRSATMNKWMIWGRAQLCAILGHWSMLIRLLIHTSLVSK